MEMEVVGASPKKAISQEQMQGTAEVQNIPGCFTNMSLVFIVANRIKFKIIF